jgi:hypothetical protein
MSKATRFSLLVYDSDVSAVRLLKCRVEFWHQFLIIGPVLLVLKIEPITAVIICGMVYLSGLLLNLIQCSANPLFRSPMPGFFIVISVSTMLWILALTYSFQSFVVIGLVVTLLFALLLGFFSVYRMREETEAVCINDWDLFSKNFLIVGSLCFSGWTSLAPYLISIAIAQILIKRYNKIPGSNAVLMVCGSGLIWSYGLENWFHGQYWSSFDQLWRSGIGNSLVSWGFDEHVGAVGFRLNYHWLAEGVAGLLAKLTPSSVVVTATKVVPFLGVVVVVDLFEALAKRLKIEGRHARFATFVVLVACNQFDLYSIGSMWGIGLFVMGVITLLDVRHTASEHRKIFGDQFVMLLILLPLIMTSQATLGINFLLLVLFLALAVVMRYREVRFSAMILVFLSGIAAFVVRATILAAPEDFYQQPSISIKHFLGFRGTDSYVGDNWLFVAFSSVLYLLGMFQMSGGLLLADSKDKEHRDFLLGLSALFVSCFVLANMFSIGGFDAQQIRFLQPMVVIGSWFSCVIWYHQFRTAVTTFTIRARSSYVFMLVIFTLILIALQSAIYMSSWSVKRTLGIGLWISLGSIIVAVVGYAARSHVGATKRAALLTVLGCLILTAHGPTLKKTIIRSVVTDRNSEVTKFVGSDSTQRCIDYIVRESSRETIVASNFFRIPLPTRDEKYFLLSAFSGRRMYVDGPLYVQIPRPAWLQERVDVSDNFGVNPTWENKHKLLQAGVSFFFVSKAETARRSWSPYAETVYQDSDCLVLILSNSNFG